MLRIIGRRLFHRHIWSAVLGSECVIGVTLHWDARPTKQYEQVEECVCGARRTSRYIYPRSLGLDDPVDTSGWPMDERGIRLQVAA